MPQQPAPQLLRVKPENWPTPCGWLTKSNSTPLQRAIVLRAHTDVGIMERGGANRGLRIDRYLRRAGVPESVIRAGRGFWCGAAVGAWWVDSGARVPRNYADCDSWLPFLLPEPVHGAAILYGSNLGDRLDATHMGIVARLDEMRQSIEGNRGFAGVTRDGVGVDMNPIVRKDILGYVHPQPA